MHRKEVTVMPRKRIPNFNYSLVTINGHQYYKTYAQNADGKLVIIYGKTIEELCEKYGLKPTYLVDYEMCNSHAFYEMAKDRLENKKLEIQVY